MLLPIWPHIVLLPKREFKMPQLVALAEFDKGMDTGRCPAFCIIVFIQNLIDGQVFRLACESFSVELAWFNKWLIVDVIH